MFFRNGLKVNMSKFIKAINILAWLLIISVILLVICNRVYAESGQVDVYHNNKLQFSMTYEEFNLILKSANIYYKLIDAESNERVLIELKDDPWNIIDNNYTTEAKIIWLDNKNNQLKAVTLEIDLNVTKEKPSKIKEWYNRISSIGFPLTTIILILLIIL